jgi:hypothetical protein
MGKTWVLDTETKGTGAHMVPLEAVQQAPAAAPAPFFVPPKLRPREPKPAEPRAPRRFKVVDVTTRVVLAEDAGARETVGVLSDVRSIVDVNVLVLEPAGEQWRLLTLDEQRLLWERRLPRAGHARR